MDNEICGINRDLFWAAAGAVFGLFLVYTTQIVTYIINTIRYSKYSGFFVSRHKADMSLYYFVEVNVRGNKLKVKGISIKQNYGEISERHLPIYGEIVLGNLSKKMGEGYYQHFAEENGLIRSGEYNIQLGKTGKRIIVTQRISEDDNTMSYSKYIWEKTGSKEEYFDHLFSMYKKAQKEHFA